MRVSAAPSFATILGAVIERSSGTAGVAGVLTGKDSSNQERWRAMAGEMDKMKGKAKEWAGKATGDKKTEMEGKTDQAKGDVKGTAHDAKEGARGVGDSLKKD
jgi:uncharacterized protein YjbJ (UPF0337 family)